MVGKVIIENEMVVVLSPQGNHILQKNNTYYNVVLDRLSLELPVWVEFSNDDDVKINMRSYYLMFAENNPNNVAAELADLNSRVIGYASAKVYSEADFHIFYCNDIEDFAPPIANPMNPHVYGTRTGELKSFF